MFCKNDRDLFKTYDGNEVHIPCEREDEIPMAAF